MNKRIQNILDECTPYLFGDEVDELFNYITNLQEKNEMLKKPIIVNWENAHKIKVKSQLQDRIDKAIEYIKEINNHNYSILVNGEETILAKREILDTKMGEMQKLERILRGEDNANRNI